MVDKISITTLILLGITVLTLINLKPAEQGLFNHFEKFKKDFKKNYINQAEQIYRKAIFVENWLKIEAHNAQTQNSHKLGVTVFADLTQEEFVKLILGTQVNTQYIEVEFNLHRNHPMGPVKDVDIDWTEKGKVSHIKNQGMCGSCWAFSTTGAVESAYAIFKNVNVVLSEQQLVDCSSSYGNNGCNGGWMDAGFSYVKDHGLTTQDKYPYSGRTQKCQIEGGDYKVSGFVKVPECSNLINAIQQRPISVGVDASNWSLYSSGILKNCGSSINHGVLVVGANQNFWKIKNSWGVNWGQNGYIRIGMGNTCGVCSYPSYPIL